MTQSLSDMANKNHNIYLIFSRYLKNHPVLRLAGGPAQQQRGLTRTMARQHRWIQVSKEGDFTITLRC